LKRILIIQTAFLGDVILATAAIAEAKRIFPEANIDVLVKKGNEGLLANNPAIHRVHVFDKSHHKLKEIVRLIRIFRKQHYDGVFNFQRFGSSGILTLLSGAKQKFGFKKNPFSWGFTKRFDHEIGNGMHEVARNMLMLESFGASQQAKPVLYPSESSWTKTSAYKNEPYYCIAPASVWFTKQLPKEQWSNVIQRLGKEHPIYLLGAPNDVNLCNAIIQENNGYRIVNLAGQLSLLDSAALMKDAKRNYVNDSGPLHIASAMNAPVTAFFLSTVPAFGFGPLSDDQQILEVNGLDCRPCGLHGYATCPLGHFKCSIIPFHDLKT
jgi:ADP-heptose:LPS heptosyltransferase